ncbi:hypothetical protein ACQ4PT_019480 [Festuca glaucescens]
MDATSGVRMATGNGENSYAVNSRLQEKAILETRPVLRKAIEEVYMSLSTRRSTLVVADLGCSSGPNTLLVVSEVIGAILPTLRSRKNVRVAWRCSSSSMTCPGTTSTSSSVHWSTLRTSLAGKRRRRTTSQGFPDPTTASFSVARASISSTHPTPSCGAPSRMESKGSSAHMLARFGESRICKPQCSTYMVPPELSSCTHLNEGNIYIGKTTPPAVIKLFQEQFRKDFELFLTLRSRELVSGGRMLLTFLGQKSEEMLMHGEVSSVLELVAKSLHHLVQKGRVEKKKLDSFNLPYYAPSMKEVNTLIKKNGLFNVEQIKLFESNWDPQDDLDGDVVLDSDSSGTNVARCIRAVLEPLIVDHFGQDIIEELFMVFSATVAKHLEKAKAKYPIIMVSLKKAMD